jgi:hypothetical protein
MMTSTVSRAEETIQDDIPNKALLMIQTQDQQWSDWKITNDGVMGGLSTGHIQIESQVPIFYGRISIENFGGFTSVFKKISKLPEAIENVVIRIKGDGNRYQLRFRSEVMGYDLAYKVEFLTQVNQLETHMFALADLTASVRGRVIANAPLLKANTISQVGFLMTAKQPLDFSLAVHAIEFY